MKPTFSVVCYKSKVLSNGESPLMIKVTKDGKRKYQSLGVSLHPKFWDFKKNQLKPNAPNYNELTEFILTKTIELQKKVISYTTEGREFTATSLLSSNNKKVELKTVSDFYIDLITQFQDNEHCGNRLIYKSSLNSLLKFTKGKLDIPFSDIDVNWLNRYEKWQRNKGNKDTSISLMFRTLRSAFNKAIQDKCARQSDYPFDEFKINRFSSKTPKRAIAKDEVLKIRQEISVAGKSPYYELSKDLFVFSYLCGGINFTDMANLTADNIDKSRLTYYRQKTGKLIKLGIPEEAMKIIDKYHPNNSGYIFPILDASKHITAIQKQNRIHKILGKVNRDLKVIAQELGITTNLTTYVARHSFASVLKKAGVNVALISEALGHSSLTTTQIYLDSFDNEQIDEAMKNLL